MNHASLLRFVVLGTIWGGSYTFIKVALDGFTPAQLVLGRLVLGAVFLASIAAVSRIKLPSFGIVWAHISVTATFGMVAPFLFLAWGEQRVSAAMAGVIIAALPLVTLALATAVLPTERATSRKTLGLLLGFAGVVLVISPWGSDPGSLVGQLLILAAAASYAVQTVYIRKYLSPRGLSPIALATAQLIVASVLQAVITPVMAWETPTLTGPIVASLVALGVLASGVAYVLYFRLIGDLGATTASAVNYLVPVTAVLISTLTLGEAVTWNMLTGVAAVLLGLAIAENRLGLLGALTGRLRSRPAEPAPAVADAAQDE